MSISGSRATESFADALDIVARTPIEPAPRRPAFDLVMPAATDRTPGRSVPSRQGSIAEAAASMRAHETSAVDLVERVAEAIADADALVMAVAEPLLDRARAEARQRDQELAAGFDRGPLHGIPITVKDVIDVAGAPTRAGSAAYADVPLHDAEAVARLRHAGAIVVAKVTTHEFALGVTSPQSRNPHDHTRIPGGSSGGSAAGLGVGIGLGSLGTDTRASIRVPAALSGAVGFKPTYGCVPTTGVVPLSWTMDHVAPMATTVSDVACLFDALAGPMPEPRSVSALRIGVPAAAFDGADAGVVECVEHALTALRHLHHHVDAAANPSEAHFALANAAGLLVSRAEAASYHRRLGLDRSLYWDEVADQLDAADQLLAVDYLDAQRLRGVLRDDFAHLFQEYDLLAMPTTPVPAPLVEDFAEYLMLLARNAIPWSFVGFPAVSLPCGFVDGLPVGLQLVAAPHADRLLLRTAHALETLLVAEHGYAR